MPTPRASPPPSRRRRAPTGRWLCWSATSTTASTARRRPETMRIAEALEAFRRHRGEAIVVPGRGGRFWTELADRQTLDAPLGDPAMGGHAGFGLGLALARPERKLVLFDSEG